MLYRHHANNVDAKEPGFKLSFKERAKIRYDFPQFIPDGRFEQLTIIYEYHKNSIKDPRIHKLLNNISKIYYSKSYMAKYYYLMRVKEYSYMHKIHLVLNSLVSITLKKVYMWYKEFWFVFKPNWQMNIWIHCKSLKMVFCHSEQTLKTMQNQLNLTDCCGIFYLLIILLAFK